MCTHVNEKPVVALLRAHLNMVLTIPMKEGKNHSAMPLKNSSDESFLTKPWHAPPPPLLEMQWKR